MVSLHGSEKFALKGIRSSDELARSKLIYGLCYPERGQCGAQYQQTQNYDHLHSLLCNFFVRLKIGSFNVSGDRAVIHPLKIVDVKRPRRAKHTLCRISVHHLQEYFTLESFILD
jgi:hypothetical protein